MIFNEWTYALFLLVAILGFALLPLRLRAGWLAAIGAAFYAFYGGLWLALFVLEIAVSRFYLPAGSGRFRGAIALLGIVQAVLILTVVKYGAFFGNSLSSLLRLEVPQLVPFALPLGISFFIFEFIHYAADRYRGKAPPLSLVEYASFILFFPTMIAGPIKRVQDYIPAVAVARVNSADLWNGALRIAIGLAKKAVLADNLNVFLEWAFNAQTARAARPLTLWFYMVVYAGRIYLDFSAYSDIAIGSARLFGIVVKENFNWPYWARNPSEFWRRWHISLSRFITDYIFIPLGGSRAKSESATASAARGACNVFVAMGLSGLWHGAAINFLVWGLYHATILCGYRLLVPMWSRAVPERLREHPVARLGYRGINFVLVVYGWIFFAMPLAVGRTYATRMLGWP